MTYTLNQWVPICTQGPKPMVLNRQCSPSTLTPKIRKKRPSRLHTEQQRNQNSSLLRGLRRNTVTPLTHGVFSLGEGPSSPGQSTSAEQDVFQAESWCVFLAEETGAGRIMVTFEGPGKVEEGGQTPGAHSHNYPGTEKKCYSDPSFSRTAAAFSKPWIHCVGAASALSRSVFCLCWVVSSESFVNLQNMYIRRHTWGLGEHQSKEDEQIDVSGVKMNFFKLLMTTDYLIIKKTGNKKIESRL